jgi:hypothetical protein
LDQHREVVGHQTIVVQAQAEPTLVAPEQIQEGVPVLVIGEDRLAVVAAVRSTEPFSPMDRGLFPSPIWGRSRSPPWIADSV